jgi:glycosyltransferase involved in cell wall biosynthesis
MEPRSLRIALVYDCLYPHTVGGAERRYLGLAARLAARHHVTYVTRRQWPRAGVPEAPAGVEVVSVSGGQHLYGASGRRKIMPPLRFGCGVLRHLLRHRHRYDIVHVCSFPYFSLLAARLAHLAGGPPLVTDWLEVWSREYWTTYLGGLGGRLGAAVQGLCVRASGPAFVLSELHAQRLRQQGFEQNCVKLKGAYDGAIEPFPAAVDREPLVVYAGRHIGEKRVSIIPQAIAAARLQLPTLRGIIFGDGPERHRVLAEIHRLGLDGVIACPGFMPWEQVDGALRRAMCLLLPSQREGYGLVVVEAAARGTPSVVAAAPDNAATELIADGQNGVVARDASPLGLAEAMMAVHAAGPQLLSRTRAWFAAQAPTLTLDASLAQIESLYLTVARPEARSVTVPASRPLVMAPADFNQADSERLGSGEVIRTAEEERSVACR